MAQTGNGALGSVFANQERRAVWIPGDPLRVSAISEASERSGDASKTAVLPHSAGPRQGSLRFYFPESAGSHKGADLSRRFEASSTPR